MTTKISSKGQIVLPVKLRRKLDLQVGDELAISMENSREGQRIILSPQAKKPGKMRIIKDPLTGWPVLKGPPGSPKLTSEMVKEMLADFP